MASVKDDNGFDFVMDKWKREQILGSGGFGMVSLWRNVETNERIALKQCRFGNESGMTPKHKERWKQEVDIMHRLAHPNVVKAIHVPESLNVSKTELPILGMEYCSGGDLRKVLNRAENCCGLSEDYVRQILKQIASAIEYLHSLRIIHRDLKPENVVLQPQSDGKILYKLIDLGYAKELDQSSLCSSFVGTLQYLAPELFLSKQYSSAVDNWSFGLLTHETITGRRPFLPNLSPAQWIPIVSKKSASDICAYIDSNGKVSYSKELSEFNKISSALKFNIENWMRMVLEWDPKKRGGKIAFQMLSDILSKHIVHVFVINSLEIHSYEISEDTNIMDIKLLIESNTGINCDDQHLFLPRGLIPIKEIGRQIINNWYRNNNKDESQPITMFVFDKSKIADYNPYSACVIPPSVEEIMLNPTQMVDFEDQKTSWKHAVWVMQQAIKKYQYLHDGVKILLMNCLSLQGVMQKISSKLNVEFNKLLAVAQFFKNSIKFNLEQCEKYKITSSLLRSLKDALEELKEIYNMQEKINKIFLKSQSITTNVIEAQRTPQMSTIIKSKPNDDSLSEIYTNITTAYDTMRKRPKEERSKKSNNALMVKLLCDCFQMEEKLMKDIFVHLRKLIDICKDIEGHHKELEITFITVAESQQKLNMLQSKIQFDLWHHFEPQIHELSNGDLNGSLRNRQSNVKRNESTSDEILNENETLMVSIDSIISKIQMLNQNSNASSMDDSVNH